MFSSTDYEVKMNLYYAYSKALINVKLYKKKYKN